MTSQVPTLDEIEREQSRRRLRGAYRTDPAAFVRECFTWPDDEGPAPYQEDALTVLARDRRASVRSLHGAGKTTVAAWAVIWFALVFEAVAADEGSDWKVVTTASAWRQLVKYLWPEVHKWSRRVRWERLERGPFTRDELLQLSLKLGHGEAFAVASDDAATIEGAHAAHLLYVFDESKSIPVATWDAAEGALQTGDARALSISTPGPPSGRFYDIQSRRPGYEDWVCRHVKLADAVAAYARSGGKMGIDPARAEQRRRQWGAESALYKNRVLGEFASSEESSVIPLAWVEAAVDRWRALEDAGFGVQAFDAIGVDVGGGGESGDPSVLAPRVGLVIPELQAYAKSDTMSTTGYVVAMVRTHGGVAVVDVIGVGAGVVHRLREQKVAVVPFNASSKAAYADGKPMVDRSGELRFINLRAAAWWGLRDRLDPQYNSEVALPPDDLLVGDLTAPRWAQTSSGLIKIEDKDEVKRRIGRSTDRGDAVVMVFAFEIVSPLKRVAGAPAGFGAPSYWRSFGG